MTDYSENRATLKSTEDGFYVELIVSTGISDKDRLRVLMSELLRSALQTEITVSTMYDQEIRQRLKTITQLGVTIIKKPQ